MSKRRRDTKWLDQLRAEAIALVNKSNSKFRPERQVTRQAALAVVDRSLAYTSNSSQEIRSFSALRALSSFISLATISKATVSSLENSDLLPIGHPFSTAPHAMSASALRSARAQWVASDPLVDDSIRALVASAHSLEPGSIERQHAFARLIAAGPQLVPITAAIDIGDVEIVRTYTPVPLVAGLLSFVGGNSRAARSMRAKLQRRDRYGRFAFMGGGFSFKMKMVDGSFRSFSGRVVGRGTEADANSGLVEVELMRGSNGINVAGQIVKVPSNKGTAVKAIIPQEGLEGLPDQGEVQPDDVFVSGAQMIQSKTGAPDGWKPVKMAKDSSGKEYATQWESPDGYVVNGVGKYNHTEDYENVGPGSAGRATHRQPQLQPARQELDFVDFPAVDTWADVEDVISRDQNDYEADLKKYNSLDGDDAAQKAWVAEQEAKGRKNAADKPQILREESDSFAEQLQDAVGDDKGIRFNVNGQDVALKPTEVTDTSVKGTDENGEEREIKLADIKSMSEEATPAPTPAEAATPDSEFNYKEAVKTLRDPKASMDEKFDAVFRTAKGTPVTDEGVLPDLTRGETYADIPEGSEVVFGTSQTFYIRTPDSRYAVIETGATNEKNQVTPDYVDSMPIQAAEVLRDLLNIGSNAGLMFAEGGFDDRDFENSFRRALPSDKFDYKEALATSKDPNATPNDKFDAIFQALDGVPVADVLKELSGGQTYADIPKRSVALFTAFDGDEILIRKPDGKYAIIALGATNDKNQVTPDDVDAMPTQAGEYIDQLLDDHDYFRGGFTNKEFDDEFRSQRAAAEAGGGKGAEPPKPPSSRVSGPLEPGESGPGWTAYSSSKLSYSHQPNTDSVYSAHTITERVGTDGSTYEVWRMGWGVANQAYGDNINVARGLSSWNDAIDAIDADMVEVNKINAKANEKAAAAAKAAEAARYIPLGDRGAPGDKNPVAGITEMRWIKQSGNVRMSDGSQTIYFDEEDGDGINDAKKDGFRIVSGTGGGSEQREVPKYRPSTGVTRDLLPFESRQQLENAINAVISKGDNIRFKYGAKDIVFQPSKIYDNKKNGNRNVTGWSVTDGDERTYNVDKISAMPEAPKAPQAAEAPIDAASAALEFVSRKISDTDFLQKIRGLEEAGEISSDQAQKIGDVVADYDNGDGDLDRDDLFSTLNNIISGEVSQEPDEVDFNSYTDPLPDLNRRRIEMAMDKKQKLRVSYKGKDRVIDPQRLWVNPKTGKELVTALDMSDGGKEKNFFVEDLDGPIAPSGQVARPVLTALSDEEIANAQQNALNFREKYANDPDFKKFVQDSPRNTGVQQLLDTYESKPQEGPVDLTSIDQDGLRSAIEGAIASGKDVSFLYHEKPRVVTPIEITVNPKNNRPKLRGFEYAADAEKEFFLDKFAKPVDSKLKQTELDDIINLPQEDLDQIVDALWPAPATPAAQPVTRAKETGLQEIDTKGSTAVNRAAYDPQTQDLFIQFGSKDGKGGGIYKYSDVPQDFVDRFAAADSLGKMIPELKKSGKSDKVDEFPATGAAAQLAEDLAYRRAAAREFFTALSKVMEAFHLDFEDLFGLGVTTEVERGDRGLAQSALTQFDDAFDSITTVFTTPLPQSEIDDLTNNFFSKYKKAKNSWVRSLGEAFDVSRTGQGASDGLEDYEYDKDLAEAFKSDPSTLIEGMRRGPRKFIFDIGYAEDVEETIRRFTEDYGFTAELTGSDWHGGYPGVEVTVEDSSITSTDLASMLGLTPEDYAAAQEQGDKMLAGYRVDLPDFYAEGGEDYVQNQQDVDRWTSKNAVQVEARFVEPGVVRFFGSPEDLRDAIAIAAGEDRVDELMANVYRERPVDEVPTSIPGEIDDSQIIESTDAPSVFSEAVFDDAFPAVGEGFYKINIFDRYVPKGAADDVQSSDYTDDPAVLANKYSAITLLWALKNAISPDEETGAPATGYGLLKFDKADEYVSAEAIYDAVSRLGIGDVEVILAGIYDAGVGGEENTDRALERSAIRARDAANAPIDSFSKSIIDMTDSSRSSQIDQAKILNGMLANPDSASRVVRSLENFVEPNDKLVDIADRLMWIQDNDPDEQSVNMGTFLDQYLPLATSPSDTDRDAFRGVWGMLMSTDGGDSIDFEGLTDSDDHFRARVFQALVRAEGSELAAQDAYEELIGAYGGYPEFVIGRQRLADGEDDLNSKTTAAAFARLVAAAARPNVEKLYRYVGVSKDNSALLDMYTTKGSVFDMDPRSFTSSDVTKGDPEQQDSRNKGFDRVYFVLEPGDGMTVSAHHISPFENEKEHFGYGTFEVLSVESSFIKLGSIQEKHIVRIKQVSSRGQNTDYEPTTENLVPDYGDISMWKEVGYASQAGSNEGGFFKDPYGKKYYIKKGRSQSHVDNETLATAFYNELGLPSPAQGFGMRDGELYLVSPIISDEGNFRGMLRNEEFMSQVRDGFAVDAWLSNYDVTGMEYDNIVPGPDGQPFRIDNGGALRWRATGGSKPWFDEDVTELDTMRDPDLARIKEAAVVFGGMTEDDVARSARRLLDITPSRIIDMVASGIKDPDEAREVSRILIARREQILSRYGLDTVNPDADILGEPTSLATSMGYAARDLQPEDITAGDSFTIERVFHDADTPKGKISVEGYFPGHETQRKEWNEGTVIDVFRGAPIPPKGDKPALHRPKRPFEPKAPAFTGSAAELIDGASDWEEVRERLRNTELVFFDYETTGFPDRDKGDFSTNQPVQLGAVRVVNGEVVDRFNMHMSPGEPLGLWSRENLKRDGGVILTDEWLSEQPGKDDVHRQFTEWAGENAIFGAHNAPFDIGVFNGVIADAGIDYTPAGVIDTLKLSQQFMPSKSQKVKPDANGPLNHKLKTLVEFFGGTLEGWHSADADAEAVGNVLDGIIRAINDKPLPDLAKDAQKYERDKENFDRAKKEYAQALLDYETAKAVAAAWNCGGGGIKASGDPYGEDCNVPSIDDIIKRATPDESDFVDPDGLHSGPTDGSSSPLPDRGADDLEDYIIPFPESVDPADLFKGEKFTPTLQQQNIIAAWLTGEDVVVLAKAGTGKTTTLTLGARVIQGLEPSKRLLYIAYNRSVADEASTKFPPNTVVKTSDAVAYNFMRLQYPDLFKKFKSDTALFNKDDIAKFLGLSKVKIGDEVYEASEIASMVQDTVFKFEISSDQMLNMGHVFEAEVPSELSDVVFSAAQTYWSDILNPDGKMPFAFNEMKKLWSMSKPDFSGTDSGVDRSIDVVMLDEAQDTNDAVGSVVLNQSIQVIMVGDPDQAIYQFNGAKDQLQNAVAPYRLPLTESWRYGPEIGGFANRFLALKERVHGVETNRGIGRGPAGQVLPAGTMTDAEAVIVRSNAGAFRDILVEIENGRTVGVTKSFYADLKGFIEATEWLKAGGTSSGKKRPARMPEDLRGFRSWKDVAEEAAKGEKSDLGTKTGILVDIVEEEGIEGLYDLLGKIQQIESVSDAKKSMGGDTGTAARSEFDLPDELGVGAYGQLTDGISFSIDPVGVIITGKKTFPYKETLKKVADWNGKSKVWKISASTDASRRAALEKLQNLIRDLEGYGSTPEARAEQGIDVVVSTAHQMKGLEFGRVRVGTDFRGPRKDKTTGEIIWPNISEFNLAYVTATRAINALDPGSLDWIYDSTSANDESSFPELAGQEAEAEAEEQDATPVPEVTDESGDGGAEEPPAITTAPGGDGPSDDEQAVYDALDTVFYAIQDAADTKGNKDFGAKAGINALIDMRKKLSVIFSGNPALNDLIDETITGIETKKFGDPEDGVVDAQKKLPAIFGREAAQEPGTVETAQDDSADIVTAPDMPAVDEPMTDEQVSEVVEETPQLVEAGSFNLEFIRDRFAEADSMFNEAASNMKRTSSKDIVADVREGVNEVLRDLVAGNITLDDAYEKLAEVAESVPEQPLTSKNPDAAEIEALTDYVNSIRDAIEEVKYGRRLSEHLPPPELLNKVGEPMGTSKNGILIRRGMRVRDKNGFAGRVLDYNKTDWLGVFVRFDLDPRAQEAVKKGNWGPGVARMIRTASTLDVIGEDEAPWADVRNDAQKKKDEDKGNDPRPPSFDQQLEIYNNMIQRRSEETWSGEESDRSDDDDDDDGGGDPDGGGTGPTPSDDGGGGGNFPKVEAPQGAPEAPEDIAELARWNKVKPIQDPAQFLSEIEDDLWRESSQFAKFIYKWEDKQSYDDYFLDGAYYYMGGGAEEVNSWLVGLKSDAEGATKRDEKWFNAVVKTLDKLISLSPKTKKDMVVYRGVDKRTKNNKLYDMLSNLQPGDEFDNAAYSSTSIVESVAQNFKGRAGYLLEIVVPKGSRGFFADPASGRKVEDEEAYSNPESFSEMEAEFILPRNTVFKVISREGDKIKVVVVPKEKDKNKTEDLSSAFVKAEAPQSPVEKVEESDVAAADIDQQWQVMPASKSPEELDAQFEDYYRGLDFPVDPFINNNVTEEQERASYGMIAYQAEDYSLINGLLRNRITVEEEVYGEFGDVIDPVEYKATVKQIYSMDMLYENAPTIPEDMVLYRGVHSDYSDKLMRSYEVGDLFQDPAYSSTTISLESAEIWASSHNADYVPSVPSEKPPGLILEIIAPAGTRGIYLPAYLGGQVDHGDELEVLLDRGTTFRVITKIEDADGNTRVMRVAVVDQTKKPIDPNAPWSAPEEKITEPDAPEVDNSPETVNRLGSEVSNPAEADAVVIDRTPPDEVLVELLREGGSQTVGSRFNENWATYIEELPQKKFEETYTFPKTGKTVPSLKKRYKDLAEFLTEFAQNSTFDTGLPVAKYNIPGSSFRTLPGVEVDVDEDGDARFTVKDGIGVLFAQAVAAYSSGAAYTGTRNNEEGIADRIKRFRGQRTSENLSSYSPGSLLGVQETHESLYNFWRSYAAIMNDPSLLDVNYGTQNEHSISLAGILLNTLSFAGKLDGTFVRTLTFKDVDIDSPEHPLHALTSVGQEIAMRPSSWAKFGQGGGTADDDDGLFTATGFGQLSNLGDVALFITDPEGLAIGDFTAMAENEALLKNGRYRVVSVEKVTATRKAWDLDVEDWVVGEHTYTKITLEQSKSEPSDTPKEALTTKDLSLIQDQVDPKFLDPQKTPQKDDGDELISAQELMGLPAENAYGLSLLDSESEEYLNNQRDANAYGLNQRVRSEGVFTPIIVREWKDGTRSVYDGHHRLIAAFDNNPDFQVPVVIEKVDSNFEDEFYSAKPKETLTPVKNTKKYQEDLEEIYDNALGDDVNDANAAAMRLYQEDPNMWVATNYRLRGTKPASRIEEEHNVELSDLDTIIKAFDEEIDKVPGLPINTLLYRGTRNRSAEKLFSLAVGEEFTDLGFVSTSLEYDTAEMFSRDVDVLSGVILEIEAPAGTKGISLAAYFGDTVDTETEVVLARGTTFVVKSKTDAIDGDSRKMRIAIIDQTTSVEQEPVKADEDNVTYNDIENWTKVGPKKGSNEGGTFRDQSGNDYYVKEPRSTLHAQNEALAAALYKELQVPAVEVLLGEKNGELRTVSPIVESTGVLGYNPERSVIEKLQEGFAVDAWLANWDIAGLTFDNVIIDKDGNPIRVDPGGALMWRAQGEPKGKMFGDVVGEIDTLRSESKAPEASVIFGDMTDDQVKESAKVLLNISPERIDEIVDSIISDFADAADLKMKLRNRRQSILDRFGLTDADKLDEPVEETPTEEQVPDNSTEMVTTLGADVSMPNVLVEGRGAAPDHTPRDKELVARLVAEGPQAMGSQFVENWAKLYEEYDGSDTEAKDAAMFMWEMNINSIENRAKTDELVQNAVIGIFASTMSYIKDTLPPAPFSETGRPQLKRDLAEWREDFPTDLVQKDRLSEKAFWTDLARYFDTPELIDIEMTPASAFLRILRAWEGSGNPPQEYDRFLSFYDKKITDDDHPLKYMLTPGQEVVLRPSSWTNAGELTNFDDFLTASHDGVPSDWEDYEQVGDQFSPLEVGHVVLRVAVDNAYAIDQMSHVADEKESIIPNGRYRVKSVERVNEQFFDNTFVSYTLITLEVVPLKRKKKAAPSEALAEAAGELGVNIDAYYDEALDIDDVEQATNKFSLAKTEHMTASDAVIIKRSDEGDLIAMIEREFGPFRGAYALPGGMLDAGETFAQAADREMQEEVGFDAANAVSRKNLGSVTDSPDWDPRFVNGVSVGAVSYVVPDGTELTAQDDARAALWIPVEDLANGIYPIAFGHAAWLAEHYKGGILGDKFEVIVEASKERNARLIEKINEVREELGEPTFTQYGKDAPWWSPVAAVEEITKDLDSPLQLDYKEWRGGSSTYVDEDGVTIGVDVDYDDVYALKNGSLEPPALPFFVPLYSSGAQDSGEGYYFAKSGKRYWGRYGAAGALLRRVREDGTLEYLLAKRSANISAGGGKWAWPGGAHKDEKHAHSPQLTAYEELKEELGIYPEGIDPIATHTNFVEPDWWYETMIVDVTNNSSLTDSLKISDDENSDLGWFTEDDIRDLNDNGMLHPAVASSIEQVLAISRVYDSPLELPVYEPKEQPEMVGAQKITQTGRPKVTPENPLPLSASAIDGTYSVMDAIHHVKNSDDIAVSTFVDGGDIEDLEVRASIVVDEPTGEKKLSLRFKLTAWAADRLLDPIRFVRNNNKEDVINPAKRKALKLSGDLSEAEITEKPVMPAQFYVDPASGTVVRTGGPAKIVKVSAAQADTNRPVIYEGSILVIDDSKGKTGAVYEIVDEDGEEFFVPDYNIPIQERPYAHDESAVSYDNTVRIYLPLDATEDQVAAALRAAGVQDVRAGTNEDLKVIAENRLLSIFKQHTDPAKNVEDQLTRDELLDSIKKTENVTVDDIEFRISDTGRVEMMFSEEKAKELAQRLEIDRFEHEVPNMRAGMMYYVDNPNIMFGGISAVPREYTATAAAKSILRTVSANRLNSTMTRLLEGNQDTGLSSDSDIKKGSADYVFTTPMNVKTSLSDFTSEDSAHDLSNTIFVFSAEKLLRRLDIYGNREDQFGQRFNNHDIYAEIDLSTYRSAYEAMFKHDVDFGEYLTYISVAEDIRNEILDMLSQSGITTMYGIPVEELFVVHGDVPNRERIAKQIAENADLVEDIEQKQLSMGANPIEFRAFTNVVAKVWDFESDTGTTWFMPAPDGSKILGLVRPGSENPTMDIYVQEPSGGLYLYSGSDAESLTAYDMTTEYMRRAVSKSGLTHTLDVLNNADSYSAIEKFFTYMYGTEDENVFTGFKSGISKFDLPQYVPAGVVNHYLSEDTWRESLNNLIEWYYDDNGTRKTTDISMSTVLASWAVSNMPIEAREALETMIDTLADGIRPVVSAGTPTSAAPSYVSSLEYFIETGNIIGGIAGLETTYNSGEKTITVIYTVKRRVLEKEDGKIAIVLAVATDNGTRLFELKEPTDLIFNKKTGIGTFSTASAQYRIQPLESVYAEHDNETKKNRQAK